MAHAAVDGPGNARNKNNVHEYCTSERIEEVTQQVVFLFPKLRGGWFMWILYCSCMSRQYTDTPKAVNREDKRSRR